MNPEISVIVTIYNAGEYLSRCIDSILSQSFGSFELILVNDGSSDNSLDVINEYAKKDDRIVVRNYKENQGLIFARITGVENLRGNWICFIDADDYIPENSFFALYSKASQDTDVVVGLHDGFRKKKCKLDMLTCDKRKYLSLLLRGKTTWSLWAKLYRREIFTEYSLAFPRTVVIGCDFLVNLRLCINIKKTKFVKEYVYFYTVAEKSVTSRHRNKSLEKEYIKFYSDLFWEAIENFDKKDISLFALIIYQFDRIYIRFKMRIRNLINRIKVTSILGGFL